MIRSQNLICTKWLSERIRICPRVRGFFGTKSPKDDILRYKIDVSKNILKAKIQDWNILTHALQILSNAAIDNKDDEIKNVLIDALNVSARSAIDESEGKPHNNCPSRIYYESLRGLHNYFNEAEPFGLSVYPIYTPNNKYDLLARYTNIPIAESNVPAIDVLIIHGVSGSPFRTWRVPKETEMEKMYREARPRDMCWYWLWPREMLAREFPNIRIIAIEYHSTFLKFSREYPWNNWAKKFVQEKKYWVQGEWLEAAEALSNGQFNTFIANLCPKLKLAGVGKNPLIILGNSFGGLLAQLLIFDQEINKNLLAVLGYAVPYLGCADLKNLKVTSLLKCLGLEFSDLVVKICDEEFIESLNSEFLAKFSKRKFKIYTFEETLKTKIPGLGTEIFIVEKGKGKPVFTDGHFYPIMSTHSNTCKPINRSDIRYKQVADIIRGTYNNDATATHVYIMEGFGFGAVGGFFGSSPSVSAFTSANEETNLTDPKAATEIRRRTVSDSLDDWDPAESGREFMLQKSSKRGVPASSPAQGVVPIDISLIMSSVKAALEAKSTNISVYGQVITTVCIVGKVTDINTLSSMVIMSIEDEGGKINIRTSSNSANFSVGEVIRVIGAIIILSEEDYYIDATHLKTVDEEFEEYHKILLKYVAYSLDALTRLDNVNDTKVTTVIVDSESWKKVTLGDEYKSITKPVEIAIIKFLTIQNDKIATLANIIKALSEYQEDEIKEAVDSLVKQSEVGVSGELCFLP